MKYHVDGGEEYTGKEIEQIHDRWIDRHSVDCYFCGVMVDERECIPADEYNNSDGGDMCPTCQNAGFTRNNGEEE